MTAFATELGLMQFKVLPFGRQGAPAAFSRMMRKILSGLSNVKNYIDDIVVHHAKWDDHVKGIKLVLQRLKVAGLTARPSKYSLGFEQVEFLGHLIGNRKLAPTTSKLKQLGTQNHLEPRSSCGASLD
ncbi:transposon ty3-i Gag-Pol polyprotein [Plakobranchus ocellatus]|uniref:Transposon ty3-i Gag-Pol polyprotein n=1 Tax=Plakobranchus ocellatus TaxID=259542 RepID=A0AAV4BIB0_9GAST|nr:transposon ty3-i Gag-Pol polyprotein [Plakobranchus ocellatus]